MIIKTRKTVSMEEFKPFMSAMARDFEDYLKAENPTWKPTQIAQVMKQFKGYTSTPTPVGPSGGVPSVTLVSEMNVQQIPEITDIVVNLAKAASKREVVEKETPVIDTKTFADVVKNVIVETEKEKRDEFILVQNKKKEALKERKRLAHAEKLRRDRLQKETFTRRTAEEEQAFKNRLLAAGKKYIEPKEFAEKQRKSRIATTPLTRKDIPKIKEFIQYTPEQKKAYQEAIAKKSKHRRYFTLAERIAYQKGKRQSS